MNSRLMFLNTVLALALALVCWRMYANYQADTVQRGALLRRGVTAADVQAHSPADPGKPASAASFLEIAQRMLFAKDRNPDVVIEMEAPPAPPPPPPVPPFPAAYGMMGLNGDVVVLLGDAGKQKGYRIGDSVGAFKLAAIKGTELTFEWNGQTFVKTMDELKKLAAQASAAVTTQAGANGTTTTTNVTMASNPALASQQNIAAQLTPKETYEKELRQGNGPGLSAGFGQDRACDPADTSPAGTIQGGYRKRVTPTPFGVSCIWEPVRQ